MKAMILAAGLGTRLRPLTDHKPKALVEVEGTPLLEHVLKRLIAAGVTEVIINVHHFAEQIIDFVESRNGFGIRVVFSRERELLDTGGGLKKAGYFFDDDKPFFLHNVDVLTDLDLNAMYDQHQQSSPLATLAVNRRQTARYFIFDETHQLCGWENRAIGESVVARPPGGQVESLAFCGIHVISPAIFNKLCDEEVFSITKEYLRLVGSGERIQAFDASAYRWRDAGKLQAVSQSSTPKSKP